jgi:hypothetical protein
MRAAAVHAHMHRKTERKHTYLRNSCSCDRSSIDGCSCGSGAGGSTGCGRWLLVPRHHGCLNTQRGAGRGESRDNNKHTNTQVLKAHTHTHTHTHTHDTLDIKLHVCIIREIMRRRALAQHPNSETYGQWPGGCCPSSG